MSVDIYIVLACLNSQKIIFYSTFIFQNRLSVNAEILSPDEEIHKILNMYLPEELGEKAEKYLMNLRTDIYDMLEEYDNDVRVQIYIFRNSHSFGTGSNCIVINITDSSIDMKVKINNRTQSQRETVIEDQSVVKWANTTKNVLKRMSSLNFL